MSQEQLYRVKVRAQMCLHSGMLHVDVLPLSPLPPGVVRLGPDLPTEIPLDLVPLDLQAMGSKFWMVFNGRRQIVGVEGLAVEPAT